MPKILRVIKEILNLCSCYECEPKINNIMIGDKVQELAVGVLF